MEDLYKKILVATGRSENVGQAVNTGIETARRHNRDFKAEPGKADAIYVIYNSCYPAGK